MIKGSSQLQTEVMCIVLGKNSGSVLCARQDFRGLIVVRELGKTEGFCKLSKLKYLIERIHVFNRIQRTQKRYVKLVTASGFGATYFEYKGF